MAHLLSISFSQMNFLRRLEKDDGSSIFGNFRPVQSLNKRTIRASFQVSELKLPSTTTAAETTAISRVITNITTAAGSEVTSTTTTATGGTESARFANEYEAGSSAVSLTTGLFLSMLFSALFVQ